MTKHLATFFLLLASISTLPALATETVRLQLKWQHQFQFAGYYAAKEQGYYAEAGLDVEIIEAKPHTDPTKVVLQNKAEYGTGNNSLLLLRNAGKPVVVLAVIFQHSPFAILTQQHSPTQNIHDLANKRLMIEPLSDELVAYLKHEGLPLESFELVEYKHNIENFISGKVDAISAYVTDEPYILKKKNIPFYSYSPRSAGIDFYGDNLFTTEKELKEHPQRSKNFREASLRGWQYAMDNQQEIADLIIKKYSKRKDRDSLLFEAQAMQQLMHPEIINIGYMLPGRWRHIAETYADLGMLPKDISLEGFLYNTEQQQDYFWLYIISAIVFFILAIVTAVSIRFLKLNNKLIRLLHLKSQFANIGESVNNISHQWKQPLNELGIQLMLIETITKSEHYSDKEKNEIKKVTDKSHDLLEFMANTVDVFGNLLKTSDKNASIHPKIIVQDLLQLIRDSFKIHKITITSELDENIQFKGNSTELSHIILCIINNARDIFLEREINLPHIHIHLYRDSKSIHIDITDNAGGIKATPVDNIFKLGFSNKKATDSGVGLYITKQLIEKRFLGTICAKNTDSGAAFKISIPAP